MPDIALEYCSVQSSVRFETACKLFFFFFFITKTAAYFNGRSWMTDIVLFNIGGRGLRSGTVGASVFWFSDFILMTLN